MSKFENWTIAYRRRNNTATLLEDTTTPFTVIPNDWRYWRADPHLFEHNGRTYLFAELYDRILRRGVIGCCELTDNGATPWQVVLHTPFHLSYPHVFEQDGQIYMIPESYVAEEIALYKAIAFPAKWERVRAIKSNFVAVDSTLLPAGDDQWMLTLRFKEGHEELMRYPFRNLKMVGNGHIVSVDDSNRRPAGHAFYHDGKLLRPAQDCTESYGCALNFYEIQEISPDTYRETLLRKRMPTEIKSDLPVPPEGIHTYNFTEQYEVLDLKGYETDYFYPVMRIVWGVHRRIKALFGRKNGK